MATGTKRDIIIWSVFGGAILVVAATFGQSDMATWRTAFAFAIVAAITQRLSIPISPKITASLTLPVLYASGIVLGPSVGGLVALLSPVFLNPQAKSWSWRGHLFNRGQVALATALGSLVYTLLRDRPAAFGWRDIVAMAVGALVVWLTNVTAVSAVISATQGDRLVNTFNYYIRGVSTDYLAITSMAILMAGVYFEAGWAGVILLFFPLLIARHAIIMYTEMKKAYGDTIASLSVALEARDAYTAGHSRRVAEIAVRIGRELALSEADLETLRYAGLLHDVGKIGIEDRLLKKPARFTPAEYEEIQVHASLTGSILEGVSGFEIVNDWAKHHHERFDGSGYPDGLRGPEIPIGSRILAVADAFDAMASRRVYKPSIPFAEILHELVAHRGSQFDPQVLEAFLRVMEKPGFKEWVESELPYFAMPGPEEVMAMVEAASKEPSDAGPGGTNGVQNGNPGDQPI